MKRTMLCTGFALLLFSIIGCGDDKAKEPGTHTHDDGSVHKDHNGDSAKPQQQEFKVTDSPAVKVDSADKKEHTHKDGKPHTH
jgi:hypothetical protein